MKNLLVVVASFCILSANAQNDFLKLSDGQSLRVEITQFTDSEVSYRAGKGLVVTLTVDKISFVETEQNGIFYYTYDVKAHDINSPELQQRAADNPESLMKKGGKVYIPISSTNYKNVLGRFNMREELKNNYDLWEVVDTEYEAEFILDYFFEEDGKDRCFFRLKTREGNVFYSSREISSEGSVRPSNESKMSVHKLCEKEIKDKLIKGVTHSVKR
jgi:hypothetical protein